MGIGVNPRRWRARWAIAACSLAMGCRFASCGPVATDDPASMPPRAVQRPTSGRITAPALTPKLAGLPLPPAAEDTAVTPPGADPTPEPEPQLPVEPEQHEVDVDAAPDIGFVPLTVHFNAVVADDVDGDRCEWSFGDGSPPARGRSVTHAYSAAGTYAATLAVTFSDGQRVTRDVPIQVDAIEETPASDDAT